MTNFNARADLLACLLQLTDAHKYANDPSARRAFHTALLESSLYIPLAKGQKQNTHIKKVTFSSTHDNGQDYVLLFSSIKTLREFSGMQTQYTRVSARLALEQIQGRYALLNAGPFGRALHPSDITEILIQAMADEPAMTPERRNAG